MRRLTLWLRCKRGARALELVGPLLHPVSRSETWRRLVNLTNVFALERFHFQARRSGPWRRTKTELRGLGGRASIARGGPKNRRNRQQNYNTTIVPDQEKKPKE